MNVACSCFGRIRLLRDLPLAHTPPPLKQTQPTPVSALRLFAGRQHLRYANNLLFERRASVLSHTSSSNNTVTGPKRPLGKAVEFPSRHIIAYGCIEV